MSAFDLFWQHLSSFMLKYQQFGIFLALASSLGVIVYYACPPDRKPVINALWLSTATGVGLLLSGVFSALGIKYLAQGLVEVSTFAGGVMIIRLFGLCLFRLLLPLCRITPLRILEDLAELAGYGAWLMLYLHDVGVELSGIVTTSAVMTAVLAFSMQDTLGNILGGLALQLDNSIKVGDWVRVDDVSGRVTEVRWRYTAIETRNWETIIIPNSLLMKGKFFVIGRRSQQPLQWRRWIYFEVGYEHSVSKVIDITQNAVINGHIANVADQPKANCLLMEFGNSSARYALRYWLQDIEADDVTDSAVRNRIYAALQRAGIKIPYPRYNVQLTNKDDKYELNKQQRQLKERILALQQVELFMNLHADELADIAENLVYTPFVQGDIIMRQGSVAHWLYIIINGVAEVFLESPDGSQRKIDTLHGACFIGEMGLMTGDPRSATVIAQSEVLAYRLDKASFQKILAKRPELAIEISNLLVQRRFNLDNLQQQLTTESVQALLSQQQNNLLEQIRSFFRLSDFR